MNWVNDNPSYLVMLQHGWPESIEKLVMSVPANCVRYGIGCERNEGEYQRSCVFEALCGKTNCCKMRVLYSIGRQRKHVCSDKTEQSKFLKAREKCLHRLAWAPVLPCHLEHTH